MISCHTIMCDDRILQTDVVNRETMYSLILLTTLQKPLKLIVPGVHMGNL